MLLTSDLVGTRACSKKPEHQKIQRPSGDKTVPQAIRAVTDGQSYRRTARNPDILRITVPEIMEGHGGRSRESSWCPVSSRSQQNPRATGSPPFCRIVSAVWHRRGLAVSTSFLSKKTRFSSLKCNTLCRDIAGEYARHRTSERGRRL